MKMLFLSFAVFLISSCKRESQQPSVWVNATVFHTKDINCSLPVLNFAEDSIKVREFTGEQYFLDFVAKGLPSNLNVQGKKLHVLIVRLKPEESFACITLGPNYPALKVTNAVPRE